VAIFVARLCKPWTSCVEAELVFEVENPVSMLGFVECEHVGAPAALQHGLQTRATKYGHTQVTIRAK
jgi:hypothetical protein